MNLLDFFILFILFLEAQRGAAIGLIRSAFSLSGFMVGLILGALIGPLVVGLFEGELLKLVVTLIVLFVLALSGGLIGRYIGERLSKYTVNLHIKRIDKFLGAFFSMVVALFIIWLLSTMLGGGPSQAVNRQLQASKIIGLSDAVFPPAPAVLDRISRILGPSGFPTVFIGREPLPAEPVKTASKEQVTQALDAAGDSTVKIESAGCGGLLFGSGFVAAKDYVVTNAHVVAGVRSPTILDENGRHRATTVYFNPSLDIAILKTSNLAGDPLNIEQAELPRGTVAVVIGYPGGRPLEASSAGLRRQITAIGRDIYGEKRTERTIYEIQAEIEEGNSGGPLIRPDGTVIGVLFARSETFQNTGYAVTSQAISPALAQAKKSSEVSTQTCVQ